MRIANPHFLFQAGVLGCTVKELKAAVRTRLLREAQGQCSSCGAKNGDEDSKMVMEQEVHKAFEALDKINIELNDTKEKLKVKVSETGRDRRTNVVLMSGQMGLLG